MSFIYCITCRSTMKTYIGRTSKDAGTRLKQHFYAAKRGSTTYLHNAIRKYGEGDFTISILMETTKEESSQLEIKFIKELSPSYNISRGGEGVTYLEKMRYITNGVVNRRIKISDEIPIGFEIGISESLRAKKIKGSLGRSPTLETREKIRAAHIGKAKSEELKNKIRIAKTGSVATVETRAKMSASRIGKQHSEETKQRMRDAWNKRRLARQQT